MPRSSIFGFILSLVICAQAFALDLSSIDDLYWNRHRGQNLEENIKQLDQLLLTEPKNPELLWRKGRSLYRLAEKISNRQQKKAVFERAQECLKESLTISADNSQAHYWYGVSLGRVGQLKGVFRSAFLIKPVRHEMNEALRLDPNLGTAHRVLGEMLWQLPGFMGGSKKKALLEFEKAVEVSPHESNLYMPLAEAYLHFGLKDKAIVTAERLLQFKSPADNASFELDLAEATDFIKSNKK